jgi:hypothetical protein
VQVLLDRLPPSTTTIGRPSSAGRRRGIRKLAYDVATWRAAIVPTTMIAPVTE